MPTDTHEYRDLRRLLEDHGCLARTPLCFAWRFALILTLFAGSIFILAATDAVWVQMGNAVLLAFVFGQIGLLGHDTGHEQVMRTKWLNTALGHLCAFCTGLSYHWWVTRHNLHHAAPNHEGIDQEIATPMIAYSPEQAQEKLGWKRWFVRRQAWLYLPLLLLTVFSFRLDIVRFLLRTPLREIGLDLLVFVSHIALYLTLLFRLLPAPTALLFLVTHHALYGLYIALIFAPNHNGMQIFGKDDRVDFLRAQVVTSRNLRPSRLSDFLFGGLNYQIEHHLFPSLPRYNLRRAQPLVRAFCEERGIPYHETGVFQAYREILMHLHAVSLTLSATA